MPFFVFDDMRENPQRGRLINGVRSGDVGAVVRNEMRFEDAIDTGETLDSVLPLFLVFDLVHQGDEKFVGRFRNLCLAAEFGETFAKGVGMEGVFVDLARHFKFYLNFWRQRDPSRHHAHHPLLGVAVIHYVARALLDTVNAVERAPVVKCHWGNYRLPLSAVRSAACAKSRPSTSAAISRQ